MYFFNEVEISSCMIQNKAKVICNFCWREIETRVIFSASPEKRIKVVLEMCPDCRNSFGYDYNEFSIVFGVASILLWKNVSEKILMRDFVQYSESLLNHFKQMHSDDLKNIVNMHRQDLVKLKDLASKINEHEQKVSIIDIKTKCPEEKNPFKLYEIYVNRKIKKEYSAR